MIKLVFDQETKELTTYDINEEEIHKKMEEEKKEKKIILVKTFLEKYKIFFELFSTILLSIMSLIISFVGWKTNERSLNIYQKQLKLQQEQSEIQQKQLQMQNEQSEIQQEQSEIYQKQLEIYQKQLEIQANDREPHFIINGEWILEKDHSLKTQYTVKNEGGKILNGYITNAYIRMKIFVFEKGANIYYYDINDAFYAEDSSFIRYDDNNKEFVFWEYDNIDYDKLDNALETELRSIYGIDDILVSSNFYLTMNFIDYKNEEYERTYYFTSFSIQNMSDEYTEDEKYLGSKEYCDDISSIAYDIYEKIESLQK